MFTIKVIQKNGEKSKVLETVTVGTSGSVDLFLLNSNREKNLDLKQLYAITSRTTGEVIAVYQSIEKKDIFISVKGSEKS